MRADQGPARQHATVVPDVAAEVTVEPNGTLSRVLYNDDQIRLVAFAFDKGQELTEHTAAVPVVIQVVSGRFEFTVGDQTTEICSDSWMHLKASVPHSVIAVEPSRLLLTLLS